MFCNKCGRENRETSLFCEGCGNKLFNNSVHPTNTVVNEVPNNVAPVNTVVNEVPNNVAPVNTVVNEVPNNVAPVNTVVNEVSNNFNQQLINNQQQNTNQFNYNQNYSNRHYNQGNVQVSNFNQQSHKKSNKKFFIFGGIGLAVIICILCIFIFTGNNSILKKDLKRTIMIYMIGSDLESEGAMASLDVEEIELSGISLEDNNVIIYSGGSKQWYNGFKNNNIYELTTTGFEMVKENSNSSMGEANTLTSFLNYAVENYKSDEYSLILWDHGAGPIIGYGSDELYDGDNLFLEELESALKNSPFNNSNKLEFIGFDACLMASAEVAFVLSDYSNYMIASQDLEPGYGWDYNFLSKVNGSIDTETLGIYAIDYLDDFYRNLEKTTDGYIFDTTLSLLDLTKIDDLEESLNDLFEDVDITLSNNGYSKIVSSMTRAKSFGYAGYDQSYDLIDLSEAADELEVEYGNKAKKLKKSIDDVVIYQKTNVDGANGLSIYYPYYTKSVLNQFLKIYVKLDFASEYTEFLNNYSKILTGERLSNYSLKATVPEFSNNDETLSVQLDENVVSTYNNANYVIFRDMKDGYYMPVYKSSDVTLDGNLLIANFNKKQLSVIDENDESGWATMYEVDRNDLYTVYAVPIILYKYKDVGWDTKSAKIHLRVDKKHPNGVVVNVVSNTDVNNPSAMKELIKLEEWDSIQFFNSEYKLFDNNGVYTNNWESSGTYYLAEVSSNEKYKVEFTELDDEYDYYCLFQVYDTQGNVNNTNLIKVN